MSRSEEKGLARVGVVVIGRNEGERLLRCLASIPPPLGATVYVDSGSIDDSAERARAFGVDVVTLDSSEPFTAARARNAGVARLLEMAAGVDFVQVVDGDCELAPEFIATAMLVVTAHPRVAVVCGRRRERHPERSIYNRLCEMEWETPVGEAESSGGDALLRLSAFCDVGGYDAGMIAGEEPEFCFRLRRRDWSVRRIDCEMTLHDAAMTTFTAWWRRAVRAGHAYAEVFARHGYWRREVRSVLAFALALPLLMMLGCIFAGPVGLVGLSGYLALYLRVRAQRRARGDAPDVASLYAAFCVIAKFAHFAGMCRWQMGRLFGRRSLLIEYKAAPDAKKGEGAEAVTP
ncbi:MAG TPA: glycosyltransferase family A protein [Polyangiaceae bacterium]|nr:glycosyltransferase family A protein [Polyangiaceae bacterium]